MNKFTYRVQRFSYGNFDTDTMNSCFEDGEQLVAIVPFDDNVKIVTMKRVQPVMTYNPDSVLSEHD